MTTTLTIFEGYAVGTIEVKSIGKGVAHAVVTHDDGTKATVAEFKRDPATVDERWLMAGHARSLKRGWRLDTAVNAFYSDKYAVSDAILGSNYSDALKFDLIDRLASA